MTGATGRVTAMLRYECNQCTLSATVVDTEPGRAAWSHHMETHLDELGYRCWSWAVLELLGD